MKFIIAAPATLALVYRAYSKNSLTPLGIFAAALTAIAHAVHPWNLPFVLLVVFFLAGTRATHVCFTPSPSPYLITDFLTGKRKHQSNPHPQSNRLLPLGRRRRAPYPRPGLRQLFNRYHPHPPSRVSTPRKETSPFVQPLLPGQRHPLLLMERRPPSHRHNRKLRLRGSRHVLLRTRDPVKVLSKADHKLEFEKSAPGHKRGCHPCRVGSGVVGKYNHRHHLCLVPAVLHRRFKDLTRWRAALGCQGTASSHFRVDGLGFAGQCDGFCSWRPVPEERQRC